MISDDSMHSQHNVNRHLPSSRQQISSSRSSRAKKPKRAKQSNGDSLLSRRISGSINNTRTPWLPQLLHAQRRQRSSFAPHNKPSRSATSRSPTSILEPSSSSRTLGFIQSPCVSFASSRFMLLKRYELPPMQFDVRWSPTSIEEAVTMKHVMRRGWNMLVMWRREAHRAD